MIYKRARCSRKSRAGSAAGGEAALDNGGSGCPTIERQRPVHSRHCFATRGIRRNSAQALQGHLGAMKNMRPREIVDCKTACRV